MTEPHSQPKQNPKIITLCGSTRYKAAFEEWNVRLTLSGAIVQSIVIPSHAYGLSWSEVEKQTFDAMHLAKIDMSDEIFVLDVGGYVGESTAREISHATQKGVVVRYLSREFPDWTEADCHYGRP
jgi:hypothetical protein